MTAKPKIAKANGRSVAEWTGRTPDSKPPQRVRLRVFDRWKGKCHISGLKINPGDQWELDHIKRLDDGGENSESNMAPALRDPHRLKTAAENTRGAKADRQRANHIGALVKKGQPIKSRGFQVNEKQPKIAKAALAPRPLFEDVK